MTLRLAALFMVLAALVVGAEAQARGAWTLSLPDTVTVTDAVVTLAELSNGPVPPGVGDLVIRAGLEPNTVVSVSRQDILRRLVTAGCASGVRLTGAPVSRIMVSGREVSLAELENEVRRCIQKLVPVAREGAPASWFELELPDLGLSSSGNWKVELDRNTPLTPGRNHVRVLVVDGTNEEAVTVPVTFHLFGEVATLKTDLEKNEILSTASFSWEWRDLAEMQRSLAVGRRSIQGCSAARDLTAGRILRQPDLKETPVVLAGESVDLRVVRGQVCVTVRAVARQDGCLGQNIPVKNELTGRLVNARVAGPGYVEWRK